MFSFACIRYINPPFKGWVTSFWQFQSSESSVPYLIDSIQKTGTHPLKQLSRINEPCITPSPRPSYQLALWCFRGVFWRQIYVDKNSLRRKAFGLPNTNPKHGVSTEQCKKGLYQLLTMAIWCYLKFSWSFFLSPLLAFAFQSQQGVKNPTWNLTEVAPWNPKLVPGSAPFSLSPIFETSTRWAPGCGKSSIKPWNHREITWNGQLFMTTMPETPTFR